jgi:hypothetical protein
MCLRFAFLLITQVFRWLRLSRREDAWKTAEILILRHQVAILQYSPAACDPWRAGPRGPARAGGGDRCRCRRQPMAGHAPADISRG